jgi:hypothetical protein
VKSVVAEIRKTRGREMNGQQANREMRTVLRAKREQLERILLMNRAFANSISTVGTIWGVITDLVPVGGVLGSVVAHIANKKARVVGRKARCKAARVVGGWWRDRTHRM